MTRKSKQNKDSDEESSDNPDIVIQYDKYNVSCIDTTLQTPIIETKIDFFDIKYDIYENLINYCNTQGVFILNTCTFSEFDSLLKKFNPTI